MLNIGSGHRYNIIPESSAYAVLVSQLIPYARLFSKYEDILFRGSILISKLLKPDILHGNFIEAGTFFTETSDSNKLCTISTQSIMYILQRPHDIHVHVFCFDLHTFGSRAAKCPHLELRARDTSLAQELFLFCMELLP